MDLDFQTVGPLQWVIESFFTYAGVQSHEIGLYHLAEFRNPARCDKAQTFRGVERLQQGDLGMTFRWFPISRIDEIDLVPRCLCQALKELPCGLKHIVNREV